MSTVEVNPCRVRRGIVTTHPDVWRLRTGPHFAATCCGSARCIRRLAAAAHAGTGLGAVYVADGCAWCRHDEDLHPRRGACFHLDGRTTTGLCKCPSFATARPLEELVSR